MRRIFEAAGTRVGIACLAMILLGSAPVCSQDHEKSQESDQTIEQLMEQGRQQIASGELEEAVGTYDAVLKRESDNDAAWHMKGYALHMDGKLDEAIKCHERAAQSDTPQIKNLGNYNLACVYSLRRENDKAIKHLEMIVENDYQDFEQMRDDSDFDNLAHDYRFAKILAQVDGDEFLAENLEKAEAKIKDQEFDKAAEIYQTLYDDDDQNSFVTYRLGYSLHGAGELDKALEMHKKATAFPKVAAIATYNIGCIHSLNGDKEEALEAFEKAVELGFVRVEAYEEDPDLNNVREEERFVQLLEKVRSQSETKGKDGSK